MTVHLRSQLVCVTKTLVTKGVIITRFYCRAMLHAVRHVPRHVHRLELKHRLSVAAKITTTAQNYSCLKCSGLQVLANPIFKPIDL